jgi:hypothetical protein
MSRFLRFFATMARLIRSRNKLTSKPRRKQLPTLLIILALLILCCYLAIASLFAFKIQDAYWYDIIQLAKKCQPPGKLGRPLSPMQVTTELLSKDPPTGIVVTLLLGGGDNDKQLLTSQCSFFQSQLTHFLVPNSLDFLLVVSEVDTRLLIDCLNLSPKKPPARRIWKNLDETTLTTDEFQVVTVITGAPHITRVFLAESKVELPHYIQTNPSLLEVPISPPMCQAPFNYIQGTRWFS